MDYNGEQIYIEYRPKVMAYIRTHVNNESLVEDLAQTVFVKVYSKLADFDPSKCSISTWIYTITKNTVIDHFRTQHLNMYEEMPDEISDEGNDPEDAVILEEQQEILAKALMNLSEIERDLIVLRYYKNQTLTKISETMNIPYGQIKRMHNKALEKMKDFIT